MLTQYIQPLRYLDFLDRNSQEKRIKKERTDGESNSKNPATELKPLFKIDLPGNMVDPFFHGTRLKTKSSVEISKTQKKITRLPSQKSMARDDKEGRTSTKRISHTSQNSMAKDDKEGRTSTKREPHKTIPVIFDNIHGGIHGGCEHDEITQTLIPSAWQNSPKLSSFRDRIEYFKVVRHGREHLRKRIDSTNVMVGINGRSVEDGNVVKTESIDNKLAEKRIPVSWEDQLSNFSEDVKTVKSKDLHQSSRQTNCCENLQINIQQPTSKLIWRQMVKPFSNSSNPITKLEYKNCYSEQILPASPTFIQISKLRVGLTSRNIKYCGTQRTLAAPKIPKTRPNTPIEPLPTTTKAFLSLSPQVCRIASSRPVRKKCENDVQDRTYLERASFATKHVYANLPKPSRPNVMEEYLQVTKIDTWMSYKPYDKKKRKYRKDFEDLVASQNHTDRCHVDGCRCKAEVAPEKEHKTSIPARTWQKKIPSLKFVKPVRLQIRDTANLHIRGNDTTKTQDKDIPTKNTRMIDFRIPHCEYRDPLNQCVIEGDTVEMKQCIGKHSAGPKVTREKTPKTKTTFAIDRPKTR